MTVKSSKEYKAYTVGGELSPDSSYYIHRNADRNLLKSLKQGKFCYVLNPRQTGKSSLMIRIKRSLEEQLEEQTTKYYCSIIYIPRCIVKQGTTEENRYTSEEKFYNSLIDNLARNFIKPIHKNAVIEFPEWLEQWINDNNHLSPVERLSEFVEKQLLVKNQDKIVIFFDEVDSILRSSFNKNNFWKFIESCYEKRQNIPNYQRLTFAIFGVATLDELIQDRQNKLFEIGQAIELDSFDNSITNQFQEGLKNKFNNNMLLVRSAINAILSWTNGQPFLTNQICQLLQDINEPFPDSKSEIDKLIEGLVKSKIIHMDNWQVLEDKKDEINNLKAVYNQFLIRGRRNPRLFECYQEILKKEEKGGIDANDSPEQRELLISGLVLKTEGGKLKVYNKIYELVFNQEWLKKAIASIPPYAQSFDQWLKLNQDSSYLLHGQELKQALIWVLDNKLSEDEDRFFKTSIASDKERELEELQKAEEEKQSQEEREANLQKQLLAKDEKIAKLQKEIMEKKIYFLVKWIFPVLFVCGLLSILIDGLFKLHLYHPDLIAKIPGSTQKKNSDQEGFSSGGNRVFLNNNSEVLVDQGMKEYNSQRYEEAVNYFEQALEIMPNDLEIQIYLNNAKAHSRRGSVSKIAVVVPLTKSKDNKESEDAKKVLRGIADAQDEFNSSITEDNFPLEITIMNSKYLASSDEQSLKNGIKAIIIPDLVSQNGKEYEQFIKKYNQAGLPVVCLTSTQTFLCLENSPQDQIIFYDSQTNTKLEEAFEKAFNSLDWEIYAKVDLNNSVNINPVSEIERSLENQVSVAVLLPSPQTYEAALKIAKANAQNIKTSNSGSLQLFSNHLMYDAKTLVEGGSYLEGLTLILPWSNETPSGSYIEQANKKWYGQTSWRTAASYAATKALIQAISSSANAEGKTVIQKLKMMKPQGEPPLIIVSPDAPTLKDAQLGFKSLTEEEK